jgi:hypothetical protein
LGPPFSGPIQEINAGISRSRQSLSAFPRLHPLRPIHTTLLALRLLKRYELSNKKEEIDESILHLTESLLSPIPLRLRLAHGPMILDVSFSLAYSLLMRSRVSKESEDAISAATYLRHLRVLAHARFAFLYQSVTTLLVETLEFQMELKACDKVQIFEEMAVLVHELLTSDPSSDNTTRAIAVFARALSTELPQPFPDQPLNRIIECLRLARMYKPELQVVHLFLATCLYFRYYHTMNDELLEEATSILDEQIASTGNSPGDEFIAECQWWVAKIAMFRSMVGDKPGNSEEAIYRARAFLASSSSQDTLYPTWSRVLEHAAKNRLDNFGPISGPEASSSDSLPSQLVPGDNSYLTWTPLNAILDGIRNDVITDIDEAVELGRSILGSSDPNDLRAPAEFGDILSEAFKRTDNIEYVNESISTRRQILARPLPKLLRLTVTIRLAISLLDRSEISPKYQTRDAHEVVELHSQFLNDSDGTGRLSPLNRFNIACSWASLARASKHPSVSTAYETALSSMKDCLFYAPTLQLQHHTLAADDENHSVPLDYASYQVDLGELEKAIETLERGRALLWSEMRHLRISIDQHLKADSDLGDKFSAASQDLEELTKSVPPSHELRVDDVVAHDVRAGDKFGRLLLRQRGLLKERDKLISQIRTLPGFDRFLTPPSFDTLRSSASSGPVIIINHSKPRSDILILLHNTSPSLIPTPDDFYDRANALKDKLLDSRSNTGSNQVNTIKPLPLFSRGSTSSLENLSSADSVSFKYQIIPGFGGARHLSFVRFHSMPWVLSCLTTASYAISWTFTSVLTPHRCPPSFNPVVVIPVHDIRIALPYFLWRKRTRPFRRWGAKFRSCGPSIPR